jgi:hypothetical protein
VLKHWEKIRFLTENALVEGRIHLASSFSGYSCTGGSFFHAANVVVTIGEGVDLRGPWFCLDCLVKRFPEFERLNPKLYYELQGTAIAIALNAEIDHDD